MVRKVSEGARKHLEKVRGFRMHISRRVLLIGTGTIFAVVLLFQLLYPSDRLLPFAQIDGMALGWQTKAQATAVLNSAYSAHRVDIYMGNTDKPLVSPTLGDVKIRVDNTSRIAEVSYPIYLRIIPTSILWAQTQIATPASSPTLGKDHEKYIDTKLMSSCRKQPVDATLKYLDGTLQVVRATSGGECSMGDIKSALGKLAPRLDQPTSVRVSVRELPPAIDNAVAEKKKADIERVVDSGVTITTVSGRVVAPAAEVFSWLDFSTDKDQIRVGVNVNKSKKFFDTVLSPKVAVTPGVSRITTQDFTEISRVDGPPGQALNVTATRDVLTRYVNGEIGSVEAATVTVPAREEYTRTYSSGDAGLSALLANYTKDNRGTFGVSFIELDGKKRRASYQGDKQFVTASTYKLFVAYSLLKSIDEGKRSWDADGPCFNKMISYSDNACAEAFLQSLGVSNVTKEINAIGLKNSNFIKSGGPYTTADDLALLLGMIQTGQSFSSTGQSRLLSAMRANVYRQGIPAGVNGSVADKVGFMDGLLHDAAIVSGPNGTYVLAVMTEGSSWAAIAELSKQLDELRLK